MGRKRVERLMRQEELSGLKRRKRGRTTIRVPGVRCAPDLVERDFSPTAKDRLWAADITYVRTWEGWLYVASVIDCFSRRVVGWAIEDHLRAELVVDAVEMAIARRDLRRDAGIWTVMLALCHVALGLQVHFSGDLAQYFFEPMAQAHGASAAAARSSPGSTPSGSPTMPGSRRR